MSLAAATDGGDGDLISRTLAGDEAAFSAIVKRYQSRIFRVALAIVRDASKADVITHETFVQAYFHLSKFEKRAGLETWLTRIAINRSRDVLRSKKFVSLDTTTEDDTMPFDVEDEAPDAERQMVSKQLREALDDAIETLSAQQKVIFRLRHYEEMSMEEIAAALGLNAGTVRAHLFRAVHKVREKLVAIGWRPRVEVG